MDNLLDVYTRLKLRIGCKVIVELYKYGKRYVVPMILNDVYDFLYIFGTSDIDEYVRIDFFGSNMMIKSIKVDGSSLPIYNNPYVNEGIFKNFLIDKKLGKEIMDKVLGKDYDSENFGTCGRDYLIEKYLIRDKNVKYDDLFFSDKQRLEFEEFFKMLTDELVVYAKKMNLDSEIKFVCSGKTSLVYEIGDKIIKIGKPRRCHMIPYCEYLLQPIINRDFSFDGYPIHIEVSQKVLVLENDGKSLVYSEDKQFNQIIDEIRKKLCQIGLCAKDLHPGNVGILLEDNKIHYDEIDFLVGDDCATSIESNNGLKILDKGKFVILDLDCLWISDIVKYTEYLKSIGYDYDKAVDLIYDTKCMVRK